MIRDLVSVIIPSYNRAKIVSRAIDSALAQSYTPLEVIVVDDGSRDDTESAIATRYDADSRVRFHRKSNGGVSSARNVGMREARGEFLAFLDSDDWWLPGKLALQIEGLKLFPQAGMIWTDMQAVTGQGQVRDANYLRKMYHAYRFFPTARDLFSEERKIGETSVYAGDVFSAMSLGSLVHTSTVVMRQDRREQVGFFREDYRVGEDYEFHLRTTSLGPVAFADAVTTSYRVGEEDQLTVNAQSRAIAGNFLETMERNLRENHARIRLPEEMIRECFTDAYAWAAESALDGGELARARLFGLKSLRMRPWQPRVLKLVALSLLPPPAYRTALKLLRRR